MKTLEQLRAELTKAIGALDAFEKGIKDDAGAPRDMTETEFGEHEKLLTAVENAAKAVEAREKSDRVRAQFAVPADFYADTYGEARLLLDAAYSEAVLPGSLVNVYVNGSIASSTPLTARRGAVRSGRATPERQ